MYLLVYNTIDLINHHRECLLDASRWSRLLMTKAEKLYRCWKTILNYKIRNCSRGFQSYKSHTYRYYLNPTLENFTVIFTSNKCSFCFKRSCTMNCSTFNFFYYLSNVVVSATGNQGVKFKTKVVLLRSAVKIDLDKTLGVK